MTLLFSSKYRKKLTAAKQWKIICSCLPQECSSKYNPDYGKWLRKHSDNHSQREAVFCFEGNATCDLEGQFYSCCPNTLLLIDANEKHARGYPPGTNAVHMWMFFVQKQIIARLITISDGRIIYSKRDLFINNPGLYNLLVQEWSGLEKSLLDNELKRKRLSAIFSLLFIELIEADMKENVNRENDTADTRKDNIIKLIEEHILATSGKNLSIEKLAHIAGYSKFYFLRLFKQQTGYTVHDYINLCRINRIAEMESAQCLQKEIAEELGFSCLSAYCHWRKKVKVKHNS